LIDASFFFFSSAESTKCKRLFDRSWEEGFFGFWVLLKNKETAREMQKYTRKQKKAS
jgi:hypothetical protein